MCLSGIGSTTVRPSIMNTSPRLLALLLLMLVQIRYPAAAQSGLALNEFIRHFEPVNFSLDALAKAHRRAKREIRSSSHFLNNRYHTPVKFNFTAHNRLFQITLQNSAQDIFADDVVFENTHGPVSFSTDRVYSGRLEDSPSSSVHGILTDDGHFDGHISTPDENYYIEPSHRYFSKGSQPFHTVIYKTSDVVHPSSSLDTPCKSHELHLKRQERRRQHDATVQAADHDEDGDSRRPSRGDQCHQCQKHSLSFINHSQFAKNHNAFGVADRVKRDMDDQPFEAVDRIESAAPHVVEPLAQIPPPTTAKQTVTTYEVLDWEDVPESIRHHFRKRAKAAKNIDKNKRTCMLYLQADHLFFEKMGSEEACIESMTRHVQRVNSIYTPIDFDQDGVADNISFMIKRIKVHTSDALLDPAYRFPGNYGVEKFLELFSEENYDAFCLAYMFTFRDFEGGTLGLAWTGDLKNAGGVCERNGHYRGSLKSLNTGIITFLNYGKLVPPAVSHVTMAHEMGHNFGSPHDPENNKACVPGGDDGNYIMFARATSGDKMNNRKFSPCSLKSIKPVLLAKARGPKGCFKEPQTALCGNGVVEEGEECDCGWEEDCQEECCWPQRTEFPANQKPCTLRPNKVCSPTQGPCCTVECEFKQGFKCREDNGCRGESYCDGRAPECPASDLKPNKTVCHEEFVCYKGECTGSICLAYGLESCQCSQGPGDPATKACELCCKESGDDKPCVSSFQLNQDPLDVPDMFAKPGTPCNNYKGYCDVFQKCREVDPSGPLATLRKLLLSEESLASLKTFLTQYWYTVIFIILGVLILMALIVRFCGKKTPLVRRRRRHNRKSVHHKSGGQDAEIVAASDGTGSSSDPADAIQVHPITIEPVVPLGKKVRRGERKRRDTSEEAADKHSDPKVDPVGRATKLAAQLGQLITNVKLEPLSDSSSKDSKRKSRSSQSPGDKKRVRHPRPFKSLSPEKRISSARGLAKTVISKSFEKLDLVGLSPRRRRFETSEDNSKLDHHHHQRRRRTKRPVTAEGKDRVKTIAKIGPFKLSVDVKDLHVVAVNDAKEASDKSRIRERRKKSREHQSKADPAKVNDSDTSAASQRILAARRPSVIVSKRQHSDRPLRMDKFSRSVSHPGPGPSAQDLVEASEPHHDSITLTDEAKSKRSLSVKLKRSDTENGKRLGTTSNNRLLLSPIKPIKSAIGIATARSNLEQDIYESIDDCESGSNSSLSPATQVQSLSEGSLADKDPQDTSDDSELEIVVLGPSRKNSQTALSRSKILERVTSISEALPEAHSRAQLLVSSSSSSSTSSSRAVDRSSSGSGLAFIFPEDTSSPQQTSLSVSSLSERFSRKGSWSSSLSSGSKKKPSKDNNKAVKAHGNQEDNLDNISILTDGMG